MPAAAATVRAPFVAPLLCAVFFASGASALILENLWFRQSGLLLGNSVWATSIVLSSFMAGLALGNGLAGRYGHRLHRLILWYAVLEIAIAVCGFAVILLLPALTDLLAPAFRPFLDRPLLLNPLRLVTAFALLLVPATAMGATLPLLVKVLSQWQSCGQALGRLYGWNTLGAVAGVLAVEIVLIRTFGIRGSALVAAALNALAAVTALWVSSRIETRDTDVIADPPRRPLTFAAWRLLGAAFLSGGILLALEVVWFRFLSLFVLGTGLALSVMLAVILAGIGLGGLAAGWWLRRGSSAWLRPLALLSSCACVLVYLTFDNGDRIASQEISVALWSGARLMLLPSFLSGLLFTFAGDAAEREIGDATRAVGLVALANTVGSMVGALLGGFVLLPAVGVETSLWALACGYVGVACCAPGRSSRAVRPVTWALLAAATSLLIFFPFGRMRDDFLRDAVDFYGRGGAHLVAEREGRTEIIQYLQTDWAGQPISHQMLTNGYSMSSSQLNARRYMKLYAYLPFAVHPDPRDALLICYGVGQTAKALVDTRALQRIDVVDISRDIMDLGRTAFPTPGTFPLDDPRVTRHVEDGRFFLQTTPRRYDLITGEPPPPQAAGVVNLYTRQYFQLIHDRLADGGITTYWLPVHQLSVDDSKAIIRAFCEVFADGSLWSGFGFDWMLVGTRNAPGGVSTEHFCRQWSDPTVATELRVLGFEKPEQLGALFMADTPALRSLTAGIEPLDDDYPQRLQPRFSVLSPERYRVFMSMMDVARARQQFEGSELIARLWPAEIRARTLAFFAVQDVINNLGVDASSRPRPVSAHIESLHALLTGTDLRAPILWILGMTGDHARALAGLPAEIANAPDYDYYRAAVDLAERRYADAERNLRAVVQRQPDNVEARYLRLFVLALSGRLEEARAGAARWRPQAQAAHEQAFWAFLKRQFGV